MARLDHVVRSLFGRELRAASPRLCSIRDKGTNGLFTGLPLVGDGAGGNNQGMSMKRSAVILFSSVVFAGGIGFAAAQTSSGSGTSGSGTTGASPSTQCWDTASNQVRNTSNVSGTGGSSSGMSGSSTGTSGTAGSSGTSGSGATSSSGTGASSGSAGASGTGSTSGSIASTRPT